MRLRMRGGSHFWAMSLKKPLFQGGLYKFF